jgi:hypothetical protein
MIVSPFINSCRVIGFEIEVVVHQGDIAQINGTVFEGGIGDKPGINRA